MLKLFFVIAILTAFVKSEDEFDEIGWICPSINQWGNCSHPPNVTQLLRMMEVDSNTNRYSDIYFCPHNIVKRHAICIEKVYQSCYEHFTIGERHLYSTILPTIDDDLSLCTTDRPYKKEFTGHMSCTKGLLDSNGHIIIPSEHFRQLVEYVEQDMLKYSAIKEEELKNDKIESISILHNKFDQMKCRYIKQYLELQYKQLRSVCGSKTEKFFRQLLGKIWPIPMATKNCEIDLFH